MDSRRPAYCFISSLALIGVLHAEAASGSSSRVITEQVTITTEDTTKQPAPAPVDTYDGPRIQIALLLDTSNSMDGLIDQAKSQLWKIVNEFIGYKREGKSPRLEVALYEYGNSRIPEKAGYIRQVLPFTTDLDSLSEKLFSLKTDGGEEYCGQAISDAIADLSWASGDQHIRSLFIAGNEAFTQGNTDYRKAVERAVAKDVVVHTIHCGSYAEGVEGKWRDGAVIGKGKFINIEQNVKVAHIPSPQDDEISRLGLELNDTYLPYGSEGRSSARKQREQDTMAMSSAFAGVATQRAVTKGSGYYRNEGWDLVDAYNNRQVELEKLSGDELPDALRGMKPEEQVKVIQEKTEKRKNLQERIKELNAQREAHVAAERKRLEEAGEKEAETFDKALIESLRSQAASKAYTKE